MVKGLAALLLTALMLGIGNSCSLSSPTTLLGEMLLLKPEKMLVSRLCLGKSPTDVRDTRPWCGRSRVCRGRSPNASLSAVLPAEGVKASCFRNTAILNENMLKCLLFRILRGKEKNIRLFFRAFLLAYVL